MENASKALIIAGAVLVSILLITIGIVVINMVNGNINQAEDELLTQEAVQFNSKFTIYSGEQSGTNIRNLLSLIASSNGFEKQHKIAIVVGDGRTGVNLKKLQSEIKPLEKYYVIFEDRATVMNYDNGFDTVKGGSYDTTPDGYIDHCWIKY